MSNSIEKENCSQYDTSEFRGNRRSVTFPVFANKTDEKAQTIKITTSFLNSDISGLIANISSSYFSHDIVDLGSGSGELAYLVSQYMGGTFKAHNISRNVTYFAMDKEIELVNKSKSKLATLEFLNHTIIQGDCFSKQVDQLIEKPMLLIASQMIYYADEAALNRFIDLVAQKTGRVTIVIAQANGSFLNKMGPTYDSSKKIDTTEPRVTDGFAKYNISLHHIKLYYSSRIFFPNNISYEKLVEISLPKFENLKNIADQETRCLIEFIAGTSIERLICMDKNKFYHFLEDLYNHLKLNNFELKFWNYAFFTVPHEFMSMEKMNSEFKKLSTLHLSGNTSSFLDAINEGNYEVSYAIYKQGVMSCQLRDHVYKPISLYNHIKSLIKYELRLKQGWKEFLELFDINLNDNAEYTNYNSTELFKMQSTKYNYNLIYGIPNLADNISHIYSPNGNNIREWYINKIFEDLSVLQFINSNKFVLNSLSTILFEFIPSLILALPTILLSYNYPNQVSSAATSSSLLMIYCSFWKKYFLSSNMDIHYIKGNEFYLQLYLSNQSNYESLRFKNSDGETALHKSLISQDIEKAANLLSCSSDIVKNIIQIKDNQGKLPIHYASEYGNLEILESILLRDGDINALAKQSYISYFFDLLFLLGKALYLFTSTSNLIKLEDGHEKINWLNSVATGAIYYLTNFYLNLKFPDGIYYIAFLNRLNTHSDWENTFFNINRIYESYSLDTPIILSSKHNNTASFLYLINQKNINLYIENAKGETALHFAAANNNLDIMSKLIEKNFDVNKQTNEGILCPVADALAKVLTLLAGYDGMLSSLSQIIFLKVLYNEVFTSFHIVNKATALHYAIGGIKLSTYDFSSDKIKSNLSKLNTVIKLVESGADPDLTMSYAENLDIQIIPYILTKFTLTALIPKNEIIISSNYKIGILFLWQILFPYTTSKLKPIDLLPEKQGEIYQYLKQHTVEHPYTDIKNFHWLDPRYYLYKFNILSDDDNIVMDEYGTYKGGSGKDIFNLDCNYLGKDQGFIIIIKGFNPKEDSFNIYNCHSTDQINYKETTHLGNISTIAYLNNNQDDILAIFWGVSLAEIN